MKLSDGFGENSALSLICAIVIACVTALFIGSCGHPDIDSHPSRLATQVTLPSNCGTPLEASALRETSSAWKSAMSAVNDLAATDNGDGSFTLTWTYRNAGDFNQDGTVDISDITQLARHMGETVDNPDSIQAVLDSNGNGAVDIADITILAANFGTQITAYAIEASDSGSEPWSLAANAPFASGTGENIRRFTVPIAEDFKAYYRAVSLSGTCDGLASNLVMPPFRSPHIYSVSPATGLVNNRVQMHAAVTGEEPLSYSWDFGSGITPATSTEDSPLVTLNASGNIPVTLTISNSYGEAEYSIVISIQNGAAWSHTLGTPNNDEAKCVIPSSDRGVYVGGALPRVDNSVAVVAKYNADGGLEWIRAWEKLYGYQSISHIVETENGIVAMGYCQDTPLGINSAFFLGYDRDGNLLWQREWVPPPCVSNWKFASDSEGNIAVLGQLQSQDPASFSAIVGRLTLQGDPVWLSIFDFCIDNFAGGIAISGGNIYVTGLSRQEHVSLMALSIMKLDLQGQVIWAYSYEADGVNVGNPKELVPDGFGGTLASGQLFSYDSGNYETTGYVCHISADGEALFSKSIAHYHSSYFDGVCRLETGDIALAGFTAMEDTDVSGQAWFVGLSPAGDVQSSAIWESGKCSSFSDIAANQDGAIYVAGIAQASGGGWAPCDFTATDRPLSLHPFSYNEAPFEAAAFNSEGYAYEPSVNIDEYPSPSQDLLVISID
mgnify:CR=1 FL=1